MGKARAFLAVEKSRQAGLKSDRSLFSDGCLADGAYSETGPSYPFCLPLGSSVENLFEDVRDQVKAFNDRKIPWHRGVRGGPTTHLCSSQVCCVNFLAPFADKPEALLALMQRHYPDVRQMLPLDERGAYVEFEWIGDPARDYLDEGNAAGTRSRGANNTSADAACRFETTDGRTHVVLIEWKYCESYRSLDALPAERRLLSCKDGVETASAATRRGRYEDRLEEVAVLPESVRFDDLCVEPLYQLMRQQLLASEMERIGGEADVVSVLHLSPRANKDFEKITSPAVGRWASAEVSGGEGLSVTQVWKRMLKRPDRFAHECVEAFFGSALESPVDGLEGWAQYIKSRYSWVGE